MPSTDINTYNAKTDIFARRTLNFTVTNNYLQSQVKQSGKTLDSSDITKFRGYVANNKTRNV